MIYQLLLGIEHLMTGVELVSEHGQHLRFEYESPSIMRVTSFATFHALWNSRGQDGGQIRLEATEADNDCLMNFDVRDIQWFAGPVAQAMGKVTE